MGDDIEAYQGKLRQRQEDVRAALKVVKNVAGAGASILTRLVVGPVAGALLEKATCIAIGAGAEISLRQERQRNRKAEAEIARLISAGQVPPKGDPARRQFDDAFGHTS